MFTKLLAFLKSSLLTVCGIIVGLFVLYISVLVIAYLSFVGLITYTLHKIVGFFNSCIESVQANDAAAA